MFTLFATVMTGRHAANTERVSKVFDTQQHAIDYGRQIAQRDHSELLVHNRQGQIRHRDSFGNDPCPPKDKE